MNPNLENLNPYPFVRLRGLLDGVTPNAQLKPLRFSIGEPQHLPPKESLAALNKFASGVSKYPATAGLDELRQAITTWLEKRFSISVKANSEVLPVNGTRESLFAIAQALVSGKKGDKDKQSCVLMPNPFYQIYEGAAILAGSEPVFYNLNPETNQADFESIAKSDLERCELMYICTPGNPTGQSIPIETLQMLISWAQEYDFVLVSDECYSELYLSDTKRCTSLLQASAEMGSTDHKRCLVMHSLSKRSNLPGLRSGFTAGDKELISKFLLYRTYHGSAMPLHHQHASIAAWQDENHVAENRAEYKSKYDAVVSILEQEFEFIVPDSAFYLWLTTPVDDQEFARSLYEQQNLIVLPGSFLARKINDKNPGENRIRLALVGVLDDCVEAAHRLCEHAKSFKN